MVTQAMKTYILGSATAGHGDRVNWTSLIEFFKFSLFWPIHIKNNKYKMTKTYQRYLKTNFHILLLEQVHHLSYQNPRYIDTNLSLSKLP